MLVAALLPGCWLMGDHFFLARGRVVTCGANPTPLVGAKITAALVLAGGERDPEEGAVTTDAAGAFEFEVAVTSDYTVVLTFAKSGFESKELTLVGAPKQALEVCLNPSAATNSSTK
jgi:hypothetical protein